MTVQIKVGWTQKFSIFAKSRSFKKKTLKANQRSPPHSQHKKEASSKSLLRCKKEAPSHHQLRLSTKLKKNILHNIKESPCRQGLMLPRAYYKITAMLKTGFFQLIQFELLICFGHHDNLLHTMEIILKS